MRLKEMETQTAKHPGRLAQLKLETLKTLTKINTLGRGTGVVTLGRTSASGKDTKYTCQSCTVTAKDREWYPLQFPPDS